MRAFALASRRAAEDPCSVLALPHATITSAATPWLVANAAPNLEARALSPTVGWLCLVAAVALFALTYVQRERWRMWWLRVEDPRSIGLFRIVFGTLLICNVNNLWEYFEFLFSDEGLFTTDVARHVLAGHQTRGFGDGWSPEEPYGFFDFWALTNYLQGPRFSILHFWDSPRVMWLHIAAFEVVAVLFVLGLWSRTTGILTFFLMNSLFWRNQIFWEGTELVYRVFCAYLIVARCGHAYSLDNWLRCRRLRRAGRLSERGGPGNGAGVAPSDQHPRGLAAIYRLIPAWPRRLMILQVATIYFTTGVLKNGSIWARGDAFYYALNLDHFYRFPPQQLAYYFGANLFRLMTWVTHWWEVSFPLVVVGLVARWALHERLEPLRGRSLLVFRAALFVLVTTVGAMVAVTWDVHITPFPVEWFVAEWLTVAVAVVWLWRRLRDRPFRISKIAGVELRRTYVIDLDWFSRWILGRRVWLSLAVIFHAHLMVMMNIGWFQAGMIALNIAFLTGWEAAALLRFLGQHLAHTPLARFVPADMRRGDPPIPAEDPSLPHRQRDGTPLPGWAILATFAMILAAILVRVVWNPWWGWQRIIWVSMVFLAAVAGKQWRNARRRRNGGSAWRTRLPWAYGPLGRFFIGTLIVWHMIAVAVWLAPPKESLSFRIPARILFGHWLEVTQTDQTWGMFAPSPPTSNVFLKTLVTDAHGRVWDMRTDVYAPERKPIPLVAYDRVRKMNRRIIAGEGGGDTYMKWYARYQCRSWQLRFGELPKKVELVKMWYTIPSPDAIRKNGWVSSEELLAKEGHEAVEHTVECANTTLGQVPPWILQRHGMAVPPDYAFRPWLKPKRRAWESRHKPKRD